jgi:[citrate (pro-3S)-lyase] ligase
MVTLLQTSTDRDRARRLVEACGLAFVDGIDDLVGVFEAGELVATGARVGHVLQLLAIAPSHQGGPLLGELVDDLAQRARAAGLDQLFVFTRPEHAGSFGHLGFNLLASHGRAALLEHGDGLARWLEARRLLLRPGANGAVVVNCNPFTRGHRSLVERAAARVDTLYVFVVREDRSAFPFYVRRGLVAEGTSDLANVVVLDTGPYAVSAVTFPSYFLHDAGDRAAAQMGIDLVLFGRRLAPFFGVRTRFFGEEPFCATTRAYNQAMLRILPACGVAAAELPRLASDGVAISASAVREALRRDDLSGLEALVPPSTMAWLQGDEGRAVRERLVAAQGRHT